MAARCLQDDWHVLIGASSAGVVGEAKTAGDGMPTRAPEYWTTADMERAVESEHDDTAEPCWWLLEQAAPLVSTRRLMSVSGAPGTASPSSRGSETTARAKFVVARGPRMHTTWVRHALGSPQGHSPHTRPCVCVCMCVFAVCAMLCNKCVCVCVRACVNELRAASTQRARCLEAARMR